jgi:thiamine biosynthesis lipoprotein
VNLGGDLRVTGAGPDGGLWTVAIEHPWQRDAIALIGLADGAVATSTTLKRAWTTDGVARHHLIDPATGEPSTTDLNLVSVVAGQAWMAEVLAKSVLLRGAVRAFDLLDPSIANALTVDRDGVVRATPGLIAHLGGAVLPERVTPPDPALLPAQPATSTRRQLLEETPS